MPDLDFSQPQRQSKIGLVLIFATALYRVVRSLWVVIIYFLVKDPDQRMVLLVGLGIFVLVLLSLFYSIAAYRNFQFHIDLKIREFVLRKGVFSTDVISIPFEKIQQVNFKRNLLQRVLGVYSVVIETAGSQDKEIEIKALNQVAANLLAEQLMDLKKSGERELDIPPEENKEASAPDWHYFISLQTLIKLGLTSNFLRGLTLIMAFYFTLRDQFMLDRVLPQELPGQQLLEKGSILFVLGLLILGIIITVADTLIKYYGLNLKKIGDSLQVEMGLRTNTRVNLKQKRVQMTEISTNPLLELIGLYSIKIFLASSQDDLKKSELKIPGLSPEIVQQVKEFLHLREDQEIQVFKPHRIVFWRKLTRGMVPAVVALAAIIFLHDTGYVYPILILTGIYLVLLVVFSLILFKELKLTISRESLVKHSGLWIKKKQILETYRLQALSVHQPFWYKRRRIVNLSFHSAGGDLHFKGLDQEKAKILVDFLIYKVEDASQPWM